MNGTTCASGRLDVALTFDVGFYIFTELISFTCTLFRTPAYRVLKKYIHL